MANTLWKFTDNLGSFSSKNADKIKSLYFPLCNSAPIMSSVTADLHGDLKSSFDSFLLEPVSRLGLTNSKTSRNFWIYINPKKIWSATGVSKNRTIQLEDSFSLDAGLLWQKTTRQNRTMGLKASILSFVPSTDEPIEIMHVEITNISSKPLTFIPTAAIPLYARSANNLHDHRHVTSLLTRTEKSKYAAVITPTLLFNESGHHMNLTSYFVLGIDEKSLPPRYIYASQDEFTGDDSDLEAPAAVFKNILPTQSHNFQGKEPIGALRFAAKTLQPKKSCSYTILLGITDSKNEITKILKDFNTPQKIMDSFTVTKNHWQKLSSGIQANTSDTVFDNWLRWVSIQPTLRKIFGCSFLPDFDYGKGGRGWRDLWQDCLWLILHSPQEVKNLLINNFSGVRIDGSNATIIGSKPGEFIADRNNISRVWMDHGIWPFFTTLLYIHQTQDIQILFADTTYFKDSQLSRSQHKDLDWKPEYGLILKTDSGNIYEGTILEHILIQNLVQFFNVGEHNHIRLEGADWNDGLDMAKDRGESVAFSAMYAHNLNNICGLLEQLKEKEVYLLKEIIILLDSLTDSAIDYSDVNKKQVTLNRYFEAIKSEVNGEKTAFPVDKLIKDIRKKAGWISQHIRETEWLKEGFFNGYYDNEGKRVEGEINSVLRMGLTAQVFAIISGIATKEQIKITFNNSKKYLRDKTLSGFRLNTDYKEEQLKLGRAFSFVYGDKENGAFFNHMAVMFAYALYAQGLADEGYEVLSSIYKMAVNTQTSKIYPTLPEYFNGEGRGMYSYLTGSASWFMFTLLTQAFGIRGEYGDLIIGPKLSQAQFKKSKLLSLQASFAEKNIEVRFLNPEKKNYEKYLIRKVLFNNKPILENGSEKRFLLKRADFLALANKPLNIIEVTLD